MTERPQTRMPPDESSCSAQEVFALRALGDSMLPEFKDGTVIIVDPEAVVRDGSYVVAQIGEEFIFRQLVMKSDKFYLRPLNDLYDTIEIPGIHVVKGVVIQAGNRRKDRKKYV